MRMSLRANPAKKAPFQQQEFIRPTKRSRHSRDDFTQLRNGDDKNGDIAASSPSSLPVGTASQETTAEEPDTKLSRGDIPKLDLEGACAALALDQVKSLAGLVLRAAYEVRKKRKSESRAVLDPQFDLEPRYKAFLQRIEASRSSRKQSSSPSSHIYTSPDSNDPWPAIRQALGNESTFIKMQTRAQQSARDPNESARLFYAFQTLRNALLAGPLGHDQATADQIMSMFLDAEWRFILLEAIAILADDFAIMKALLPLVDAHMIKTIPAMTKSRGTASLGPASKAPPSGLDSSCMDLDGERIDQHLLNSGKITTDATTHLPSSMINGHSLSSQRESHLFQQAQTQDGTRQINRRRAPGQPRLPIDRIRGPTPRLYKLARASTRSIEYCINPEPVRPPPPPPSQASMQKPLLPPLVPLLPRPPQGHTTTPIVGGAESSIAQIAPRQPEHQNSPEEPPQKSTASTAFDRSQPAPLKLGVLKHTTLVLVEMSQGCPIDYPEDSGLHIKSNLDQHKGFNSKNNLISDPAAMSTAKSKAVQYRSPLEARYPSAEYITPYDDDARINAEHRRVTKSSSPASPRHLRSESTSESNRNLLAPSFNDELPAKAVVRETRPLTPESPRSIDSAFDSRVDNLLALASGGIDSGSEVDDDLENEDFDDLRRPARLHDKDLRQLAKNGSKLRPGSSDGEPAGPAQDSNMQEHVMASPSPIAHNKPGSSKGSEGNEAIRVDVDQEPCAPAQPARDNEIVSILQGVVAEVKTEKDLGFGHAFLTPAVANYQKVHRGRFIPALESCISMISFPLNQVISVAPHEEYRALHALYVQLAERLSHTSPAALPHDDEASTKEPSHSSVLDATKTASPKPQSRESHGHKSSLEVNATVSPLAHSPAPSALPSLTSPLSKTTPKHKTNSRKDKARQDIEMSQQDSIGRKKKTKKSEVSKQDNPDPSKSRDGIPKKPMRLKLISKRTNKEVVGQTEE